MPALNDALKEEIQHLKVLTGQAMPNGGPMMNYPSFGAGQQFYPNNQAMHTLLTAQQFQQLQIHSQKQQQQFQQHQLHQMQQQQLQQQQQEQQQQTGEIKMRGSVPSPNQKENTSDVNPSISKDWGMNRAVCYQNPSFSCQIGSFCHVPLVFLDTSIAYF